MSKPYEDALDARDKAKVGPAGTVSLSKRFRDLAQGAKVNMEEVRDAVIRGSLRTVAQAEEEQDPKAMLDALKLVANIAGLTKSADENRSTYNAEQMAALTKHAQDHNRA